MEFLFLHPVASVTMTFLGISSFPTKSGSIFKIFLFSIGARGSVVVKEICYKSKGRGFDTR
jgi:hypothetical protein